MTMCDSDINMGDGLVEEHSRGLVGQGLFALVLIAFMQWLSQVYW